MSKSIYDEARRTLDLMFDAWDRGVHLQSIEFIEEVLEQAEKQEKLLELYKKQNTIYEKLMTMELSQLALDSNYYQLELLKIRSEIKELENE